MRRRPAPSPPLASPARPANILEFIAQYLEQEPSPAQKALLSAIYGLPLEVVDELPAAWLERQFLDALYGLPTLTAAIGPYHHFTLRRDPPKGHQADITVVCGRRSGKTGYIGIPIALYEALLGGHEAHLRRGERATIPIIAQDKEIAGETLATLLALVTGTPALRAELQRETAGLVLFKNRVQVQVKACNFRATRGLHIPVAILDEIGVWNVEGVNPDRAVVESLRPAMATFPRRRLVKLSSPWAKAGILWDDFERGWGTEDTRTLLWKAPTWYMNPTIPADYFVAEHDRDPDIARREYGAEFSEPIDAFLPWQSIKDAVDEKVVERSPNKDRQYRVAVDVAFRTDSTVLCLCHREGDRVLVDVWREWRPVRGKVVLSLESLAKQVALVCRLYGVRNVVGDQFCAEPVREAFRRRGLAFSEVAFTARRWRRQTPDDRREVGASKVDIFGAMKTLLLQGRLRLVDVPEGARQLRNLEVKRSFSGNEQIGAPAGQHDDYAAALALACWQCWRADEWRARAVTVRRTGPLLTDQQVITSQRELPDVQGQRHPLEEDLVEQASTIGAGMRWLRSS